MNLFWSLIDIFVGFFPFLVYKEVQMV